MSSTKRRRHERYRLTSGDRLILMMILVSLSALFNVCQSFSPVIDARSSRPRALALHVVETETEAPDILHTTITPLFPTTKESGYTQSIHASTGSKDKSDDSPKETQSRDRSAATEETKNDQETESDAEEEKSRRLAKTKQAAALLARRNGIRKAQVAKSKMTSVGQRRVGSATNARGGTRTVTTLADAIRKGASSNAAGKKLKSSKGGDDTDHSSATAMATKSVIQATVENMMRSTGTLGFFGDPRNVRPVEPREPPPGTVLVQSGRSTKPWGPADRVTVRVGTTTDDVDIANLRLSVFSDFSMEMRQTFCDRSCQVLSSRRNQGAACIVATVPRYASTFTARPDIILGTAECSFHEFHDTILGERRLGDSVLYITEVAVSPTARRKGVGFKIMKAIDELAAVREVETIYLHVDVANYGALSLYATAGFTIVSAEDPIYYEFTKSLNLHDGATKGRNHYLLHKDLREPTWLSAPEKEENEFLRGTLGFEF